MELVYLWVEEYKNIHRQGFNFSPRFRCTYDPSANKLTIDENEDYVDIFPDNINVTAIVGKNGSGKSSLLEFLLLMFFDTKNFHQINKSWGLVYNKESTESLYSIVFLSSQGNKGFKKVISPIKPINSGGLFYYKNLSISKFQNIFFNPSTEIVSTSFKNTIYEGLQKSYGSIYELDGKPDNLNIFAFPSKENLSFDIKASENIALINMFQIDKKQKENIANILKSYKIDFIPSSIDLTFEKTTFERQSIDARIKNFIANNNFDLSLKSLYRLFLLSSIFYQTNQDDKYTIYLLEDNKLRDFLENKLKEYGVDNIPSLLYDNVDTIITQYIGNQSFFDLLNQKQFLHLDIYQLAKLIDYIRTNNLTDNFLLNTISDQNIIIGILKYIPSYIHIDVFDSNHILFNDFSMGEKTIILQLYSISYYVDLFYKHEKYHINLVIDESELYLNPFWQKKLLDIYTLLFKNILKQYNRKEPNKYNLNVFISTHSPFLLSDIPKRNIIFLDTDEEGNCKVVDGLNNKKETFGANIHTLLSDSFFMEDGLMGEFAKGKIESIRKFYNKVIKYKDNDKVKKAYKCFYEKKQKEFWDIQSIIGEPFLQKIVKNQLEEIELILLGKNDAIDKEIARLQALKESFNNDQY